LPDASGYDPLITFHVEHIIAKQHRGTDHPSNLALLVLDLNAAERIVLREALIAAGTFPRP
jgi:hypothetical protein